MPDDHATPRTTPRRRRRHVVLVVAGGVLLLLTLGVFILTRSPVLIRIVEPRLSDALGARVQIGSAAMRGLSHIVLRDVRAVAPGLSGPPAEILTIERLDATIDWTDTLSGRFGIRGAVFHAPTLRLSQERTDHTLNLAALAPKARAGGPLVNLPRVILRDAIVEYGETDSGAYAPLATIEVDGEFRRSPDKPGWYQIALVESSKSAAVRAPANPVPIALTGEYDPRAVEGSLTLESVDLASWGPGAAPVDVRDFWTQLALQGQVARTEFVYSDARGVEARFTFEHVGLTLPIAADPQADLDMTPGPRPGPERFMRMSDASGVATIGEVGITAQITGLIEDLPYTLVASSDSLALDTPFVLSFETARPFSVAERAQLLPFAPKLVRDRFRSFSGPTAMLEAKVAVTRGEPTPQGPAPVRIAGEISFTDGEASFASFPYPVKEMAGRVRFDEEAIHIEEITGVAPTGATMRATGVIAPPHDRAEVAIDIRFDNLALDDAFNSAMPASRADLLGELFNKNAEQRLRAQHLLPDDFTLGGTGSLSIHVRRPPGDDTIWTWDATLELPTAGLLVEAFPYPVRAEHATVAVTSDRAEVSIPTIRGLGGGDGDLQAWITLSVNDQPVFDPVVMVRALGIPVDERLLSALPGAFEQGAERSPADILRALGVHGAVDTIARVLPRDNGEVGFDVSIEFADVSAQPEGADSAQPLRNITGRMQFSENGVRVDSLAARLNDASLTITGELGYGDIPRPTDLSLRAQGLSLRDPFDRFLAAFDPDAAGAIRGGLDSIDMRGIVDADVRITRAPDDPSFAAEARFERLRDLSFTAFGGRAAVDDNQGRVALLTTPDGGRVARFDGFTASLRFNDAPPARVSLEGEFDLRALQSDPAAPAESSETPTPRALEAAATVAWPSTIADTLLERAAPRRAAQTRDFLARWGVELEADISATLRTTTAGVTLGEVSAAPRRITLRRHGVVNTFDIHAGRLVYDHDLVRIDNLDLRSAKINAVISGDASLGETPALNLTLTGAVAPLDADALSILPENLRTTLQEARLGASSLTIDRAQVAVGAETTLAASLRYQGLAFDMGGTSIADADGALDIAVDTADPRPLDATLSFDSARVQRIRLGAGSARVVLVDDGQTLVVPSFDAEAYGGRVFGVAKVERVPTPSVLASGKPPASYEVEGALSGVSFDDLRADLRVPTSDPDSSPSVEGAAGGGVVDATIAVAGVVGKPQDRIGRGAVRVWGGQVLRLPLASRLIEVSNLQLPTGEQIDFAQARFYIEGPRVSFEELSVASQSVTLDAEGTLAWPSLELDLSVTSRGARRAPILSDVVDAFRNELIISRVTGPLSDPSFTVETLPATRRLLDSIFGRPNDRPTPARPAARPESEPASRPSDR